MQAPLVLAVFVVGVDCITGFMSHGSSNDSFARDSMSTRADHRSDYDGIEYNIGE